MRLSLPPHYPIFVNPWKDEVRLWRTDTDEGVTLTGAAARVYREWWALECAARADKRKREAHAMDRRTAQA